MSYTYSSWLSAFSNLLVVPVSDPNFVVMVPNAIDDAEQRIYRELDLPDTVKVDFSAALATNTRLFSLPAANGTFVGVDSIYAITPAGQTTPNAGTRNNLLPASRGFLDATFPSSNASGLPQYFAPVTSTTVIVGPWPDAAYQAEVVGWVRPAALSSTNVTTLLTTYYPDLWMAATMVFGAGYLQNYGASGGTDNPQQPMTWEAHYNALLQSAQVELARIKFASQGWSSKQPAPIATPPRT